MDKNHEARPQTPDRAETPAGVSDGTPAPPPGTGQRRRRRGRRRPRANGAATANQQPTTTKPPPSDNPKRTLPDSLQETVLRHTTAAVLGRGRGYVKRKRVIDIRVSAGRIRARVLGSGRARYSVELTAPQRPAPAMITKIRWSCDCPYAAEHRRGTCKHVVAVALVAAKRFENTEAMRRRWLGQPAANAAEAEPEEFDALAERLLAAFSTPPLSIEAVMDRAIAIAPPPFELPLRRTAR
ncbi:MAG: hypothetical protein EXQ69_06825 [Acidimicrobiia bacterium]|nr:hypothetical protein [Acidimicrobiia bacterium]